jgi:hypothetical protein
MPISASPAPILSRFTGRFGANGPRRVLPSSVDNLPAFTSFFPEIFAASHGGSGADEQALALMMMMTQLSQFKATVKNVTKSHAESAPASGGAAAAASESGVSAEKSAGACEMHRYFGSSAGQRAIEEVVLWMATAAARQVNVVGFFDVDVFCACKRFCIAGIAAHIGLYQC